MKRSLLCSAVLFACTTISFNAYAEGIVIENEKDKVIEDGTITSSDGSALEVLNSKVDVIGNNTILTGLTSGLNASSSEVTIGQSSISTEKIAITTTGLEKTIAINAKNSDLTLNANEITISAMRGAQLSENSTLTFNTNDLTINSTSSAIYANKGSTSTVNAQTMTLNNSGNTSAISANNDSSISLNVSEVNIRSGGTGLNAQYASSISLNSNNINISGGAGLKAFDAGTEVSLIATNELDITSHRQNSVFTEKQSKVKLEALTIRISSLSDEFSAIRAQEESSITINSNHFFLDSKTNGLGATGNSSLILDKAETISITAKNRGIEADKSQVSVSGKDITIQKADIGVFASNDAVVEITGNDIDIDANWGLYSGGGTFVG